MATIDNNLSDVHESESPALVKPIPADAMDRKREQNVARVASFRAHRAKMGLVRVDIYAHPADHAEIKALAAKLAKARLGDKLAEA